MKWLFGRRPDEGEDDYAYDRPTGRDGGGREEDRFGREEAYDADVLDEIDDFLEPEGFGLGRPANATAEARDGGVGVPESERTKVCPQCGAVLFADMGTCYGCLYEFGREERRALLPEGAGSPLVSDAGWDEPQGEPRDKPPSEAYDDFGDMGWGEGPFVIDDEGMPPEQVGPPGGAEPERAPRHLAEHQPTKSPAHGATHIGLELRTPDLLVRCHVPEEGLSVGRDEDNDVVLRSSRVSRHHVRILPADRRLIVRDLGATNQATVDGRPLAGETALGLEDTLDVCGTRLTPVELA